FSDWEELNKGFSPVNPQVGAKLTEVDTDNDRLTDSDEYKFGTDPVTADTDNDGYQDGQEIASGYDPLRPNAKLEKKIEVNLAKQELSYYLGKAKIGTFIVSTGKPGMSTPKGTFKIANKSRRAWSKTYKLWMPYWMGLSGSKVGLHELPEWPGGKKEGENHLGRPVSHGCVRLGVGPAKKLYEWAEVGTTVIIK
ncbi:L,D-transpeptidase, partial [Candidatus Falkowbacteria bacterium]|nr:L,D-transpeptidase [Candidatus Falkowbacteria bacterium]